MQIFSGVCQKLLHLKIGVQLMELLNLFQVMDTYVGKYSIEEIMLHK